MYRRVIILVSMMGVSLTLLSESPFHVKVALKAEAQGQMDVEVGISIPQGHMLYADMFKVTAPVPVRCITPAAAIEKHDPFEPDKLVKVYLRDIATLWQLPSLGDGAVLDVELQGCNETACFLPETRHFVYLKASGRFVEKKEGDQPLLSGNDWLHGKKAVTLGGYVSPTMFLEFLDRAEGKPVKELPPYRRFLEDPLLFLKRYGIWMTMLFVLLGGVLLNLTPCVLPMIPINLAIIGVSEGKRGRGFLLGCAYGGGMMLAYGVSGWVVLKTGVFVGTLQSSPWFNLVVALVFGALALALLDLFSIDLTRFSKGGGASRQGVLAAGVAGGMSALLAGACVAPVVLAVLLLAGTLMQEGETLAQALPFVLGLGMALPWPLAGAGLSVLPRPGAWMVRVKQVFALALIGMFFYYAYLAAMGFLPAGSTSRKGSLIAGDLEAWKRAVAEAEQEGKPVLVDFWATWCKNCTAMEKTTFKDPRVVERLKRYKVILVQAEQPRQQEQREMLHAFGIRGLPGFVVLKKAE